MENHIHIGDGVYAEFDGYGVKLRVNDHRNPVAVYLEPSVLDSLNRFYENKMKENLQAEEDSTK